MLNIFLHKIFLSGFFARPITLLALLCLMQAGVSAQSLFPVKDVKSELYGYKDASTFQWAIQPRFEQALPFHNQTAIVMEKGFYGLINKRGNYKILPEYTSLEGDQILTFEKNGIKGLISAEGKILIQGSYDQVLLDEETSHAVLLKNGLYGYWDTDGSLIEPFSKYEINFENHKAYFNSGDAYGFMDKFGKRIIEVKEGQLWLIHPYGFIQVTGNRETVYTQEGKVLIDSAEEIVQLAEKGVIYSKNGRYEMMGYQKEGLLKNYDRISPFNKKGIAVAQKDTSYVLVDQTGKPVSVGYQYIGDFEKKYNRLTGEFEEYSDYVLFREKGNYGVMNDTGSIILNAALKYATIQEGNLLYIESDTIHCIDLSTLRPCSLPDKFNFLNERAIFSFMNDSLTVSYGMADTSGKMYIAPMYQKLTPIGTYGYVVARNRKRSGILETTGHTIVPLVYKDIKTPNEIVQLNYGSHGDEVWDGYVYSISQNDKVGVLTEDGKKIVDNLYSNSTLFDADGKCWMVESKGKWYIVRESGKKLPLALQTPASFEQELAIAKKKNKYGLISDSATIVLPFQYDQMYEEGFGLYYICKNSLWGIANREGKVLAVPQFSRKTMFHSSYAFVKRDAEWGTLDSKGIFKSGFSELRYDTLNVKPVNNFSILSYSYSDLKGYDEVSFELLQPKDSSINVEATNQHILETISDLFSQLHSSHLPLTVIPIRPGDPVPDIEYRGSGLEISGVIENMITLNFFLEEFDEKKGINRQQEKIEVYLIKGKEFRRIRLEDLFTDNYQATLNEYITIHCSISGLPIPSSAGDARLLYSENFSLTSEGLVLKLNEKAFEPTGDLTEQIPSMRIIVPYDSLKPVLKTDGPLKDISEKRP